MRAALLILAALSLAFAPAPFLPRKAPPQESDEVVFQGEWTEMDSSDNSKPSSNDVKYVFAGKQVRVLQYGKEVSRWSMTLGPPATPRKLILTGDPAGNLLVYSYTIKTDAGAHWVTFQGRGVFMRPRGKR
jgi:hypothetical protein